MEAAADFSYHSNSFERLRNAALGRSRLALWRCAKEYEWNTACTVHHLQLPQELRSPQLRQGHVDQDYVALIVLEQSESGGTVRSVYDRVPKAAQYICGKPALPGVAVHSRAVRRLWLVCIRPPACQGWWIQALLPSGPAAPVFGA